MSNLLPRSLLPALVVLAWVTVAACAREPGSVGDAGPADPVRPDSVLRAEPDPAPDHCRIRSLIQLEPEVAIEPDPGMGPPAVVWQGDLNGDGLEDLLLRYPDGCGNYGDCPYSAHVACGDGAGETYGTVWEPAYSYDLAVDEKAPADGNGWRTLLDTQRDGKEVSARRLRFTGKRYAIVEILDD